MLLKFFNFLLKEVFIALIYFYKYVISPFIPSCCIYKKTCSEYALEVFRKHSLIKAIYLTIRRLLSCHPFANMRK